MFEITISVCAYLLINFLSNKCISLCNLKLVNPLPLQLYKVIRRSLRQINIIMIFAGKEVRIVNSETQRLVQNVILKLEKINMVFVKPVMVKHP